jgi:TolB-like protein/Flp pilus assembly protein TadD
MSNAEEPEVRTVKTGRLHAFWAKLKERKIRKTMAIYTSSGLTTVGLTKLFTEVYNIPVSVFTVIVVFLTCGAASAFVIAWYHGTGGPQKIQKREIFLHSLFLATAILLSIRLTGAARSSTFSAIDAKSIAVLPFKNLSDSKEDEYFSDGITEDIITQLSKIGELKVISRTSVMKYKTVEKNLREIGQELNVAAILEGSVRRAGDRVRIVGQLIDAASDRHMWADTYDRQMRDIFAIQSEVAQRIASALKATLSPNELKQIEKKSTENLDAYAYYLRGREYYYRFTRDDNERAIELFKKALALDPYYALAYAGLGDAYDRKSWREDSDAWSDSAIAVSTKAVTLDPNLAEGYKALGVVYESRGELRHALELYQKAVQLNPNYAPAITNIGAVYQSLGELAESLKWFRKAVVVQPGFARWSSNVGLCYYRLEYDSLATVWLQKAMQLQPDFIFPYVVITYVDVYAQRYDSARQRINRALSILPNESIALDAAADVELISGNYTQARAFLEKSMDQSGAVSPAGVKMGCALRKLGDIHRSDNILDSNIAAYSGRFDELSEGSPIPYHIAAAYSMKGNDQQAIRWLRKAIDLGYRDRRRPLVDPAFDNLRGNTQFKDIVAHLDRKITEMRVRVEQEHLNN